MSLFFALLAVVYGCVAIDDFTEPHMLEGYMGQARVRTVLSGYVAGVFTTVVTVAGDESGEKITISGIPTNEPFNVVPEAFAKDSPFPYNFAGLVGEAVSGDTIKVTGFSQLSRQAESLGTQVLAGEIQKDGPNLVTTEHIVIGVKAKNIKSLLAKAHIADKIEREDGKKLSEIPDSEVIELYDIWYKGVITSIP